MQGDLLPDIRQHFTISMSCPICENDYDCEAHTPMLICINQHCICQECITRSFDHNYGDDEIPCPFCKQPVISEEVERFRLMDQVIQMSNSLKKYSQNMQALLRDLMNGNEELTAQLHKEREISQSKSKLVESLYIQIERKQQQENDKIKETERKIAQSTLIRNHSNKNESRYHSNRPSSKSRNSQRINPEKMKPMAKSQVVRKKQVKAKPTGRSFLRESQIEQILFDTQLCLSDYEQGPLQPKRPKIKSQIHLNKKPLPYLVTNTARINGMQLTRIAKNEVGGVQIDHRSMFIIVLGKYDFSLLKVLDLSRLNLNQKHLQSESFNNVFPRLQRLDISKNRFTLIPSLVYRLTSLKTLKASNNALVRVTDHLIVLTKLQFLDLWDNQLAAVPVVIFKLNKLTKVDLSNNRITFVHPWMQESRVVLDLFGNPLHRNRPVYPVKKKKDAFLNKFICKLNKSIL